MSKILVVGSKGFIGNEILKNIINQDNKISVLNRYKDKSYEEIYKDKIENFYYNVDDITSNEDANIDTVIYCATHYGRNSNTLSNYIETNLFLPIKLLDYLMNKPKARFINTDSFYAGNLSSNNPLYKYSISKAQLLPWLQIAANKIEVINLRLFHVIGVGDREDKFINKMINTLLRGSNFTIKYGHDRRDFISLSYVVNAVKKLLTKEIVTGYYDVDIGSGKLLSLKQLGEYVKCKINELTKNRNLGSLKIIEEESEDNLSLSIKASNNKEINDLLNKHSYSIFDELDNIINQCIYEIEHLHSHLRKKE